MAVSLYMDEHVPWEITDGLRRRNVDVLRIQDEDLVGMPDHDVVDRATALARILFTRDEDFLSEAALRQQHRRSFSGVIYAHQLAVTIGKCISDLELLCKAGDAEDFANRVWWLPL